MGASAGTGVRSFAEGGSTSAPSGNSFNLATINQSYARALADPSSVTLDTSRPGLGGGFGGINPEAIRADSRAFGIGPAAESLRQDLAREQAPPRQIYRPQYEDYGLGSTPQAQGQLAALLNIGSYGNQMPTFTRPQAGPPQAQYSIPYGPSVPQSKVPGAGFRLFGRKSLTPEQQAANLIKDYRGSNLTEAQYDKMMQNPAIYFDFLRRVDAGENPTTIGYAAPPPIQYMTAAQQQAYNRNLASGLESMIAPRTTFDMSNDPGSAGG